MKHTTMASLLYLVFLAFSTPELLYGAFVPGRSDASGVRSNCETTLSQYSYMGIPLPSSLTQAQSNQPGPTNFFCVTPDVGEESRASSLCKAEGTRAHEPFDLSRDRQFVITQYKQDDGIFCIPSDSFTKQTWCTRAREAEIEQARRENRSPVQINWVDDQCSCRSAGGQGSWRECSDPRTLSALRHAAQQNGGGTCQTSENCDAGQTCDNNTNRCVSETANAPAETEGEPTTEALNNFKTCVDGVASQARSCKEVGQESSQRCDPRNVSASGAQASAPTSSSQYSCLQAGFLSNTALHTAHDSNNTCRDILNRCQSLCGTSENTARTQTESSCLPLLNAGLEQPLTIEQLQSAELARQQETNSGQAAAHYQSKLQGQENMQTLFREGFRGCQASQQQQQPEMENLVGSIGRSLQSAAQCSCQYASNLSNTTGTAQNGCAGETPNPNACIENPSARGCEVYREMSVCTPGTTYNARLCRCQVQPSSAGCENVPTTGTLASMAGAMIKDGAVVGESSFGFHNGKKASIDLGSGAGETTSTGLTPNAAKSAETNSKDINSGQLSSVASGGAVLSEPDPQKPTPAKPDSGGAVANLLSAAKGAAKSLGGFAENILENGDIKNVKSSRSKNPDFNAFRPRGIAGGRNGLGGRNMEIWKMMNRCVQGETCPSNIDKYILVP